MPYEVQVFIWALVATFVPALIKVGWELSGHGIGPGDVLRRAYHWAVPEARPPQQSVRERNIELTTWLREHPVEKLIAEAEQQAIREHAEEQQTWSLDRPTTGPETYVVLPPGERLLSREEIRKKLDK